MVVSLMHLISRQLHGLIVQKGTEEKNMNDMEWKEFCDRAENWQGPKGTMAAVKAIISGAESESDYEACAQSVKTLLKGKDGNPFGRKKNPLTPTQQGSLNGVFQPLTEALTAAFDAHHAIASLVLPHGRSKIDAFDGESFAASIVDKAMDIAIDHAKAGTLDKLLA